MKSYWIVNRDNQTSIERRDIPVPQPRGGEFLIKVHASALNRGELLAGGVMHGGPEKIGGNEVSGTVEALGDGVSGIKVGDRVLGRACGGFAEFAIREAAQAIPVPVRLTWEQAAATPLSSSPRTKWWSRSASLGRASGSSSPACRRARTCAASRSRGSLAHILSARRALRKNSRS
jgi:NADPH:quinone reductase-like Zn-dependent oxidoreductase